MTLNEFPIPTSESDPLGITVGPDGALWFAEQGAGKIGRITTGGSITEFPLPANDLPEDIAAGSDGALWFTLPSSIGRITTGGSFTDYPVPVATTGAFPDSIASGPDGALWFAKEGVLNGAGPAESDLADDQFGRITTGGTITGYPVPVPSSDAAAVPADGVAGPDGNLWFTVGGYVYFSPYFTELDGVIARVTTGGAVTEYPLPVVNDAPGSIAAGPDGALWFAQNNESATSTGNEIGRITTGGTVTEYPTVSFTINGITGGPDGAVWFINSEGCISRIASGGSVTQYALPAAYDVSQGITTGPDGAIWFTEGTGNFIGRLAPSENTAARIRRL